MEPAEELVATLEEATTLAIVGHDDPDPDCLASALALEAIADAAGVDEVIIAYGGQISHQQNRAFVAQLGVDVTHLEAVDLEDFECVAYVDHSTPGRNAPLSRTRQPDVVIDHHPGVTYDAPLTDVREEYGATATILIEYLETLGLEPTEQLATALLFALHRERLDFVRQPTRREYEAALAVFDRADRSRIADLYGAALTPETVDAIGRAVVTRTSRNGTIVASTGRTSESDAMPQAAEYLCNVEGVTTCLVYGVVGDTVRMSARTIEENVDIGRTLQRAFGRHGSFGGHADMGGGTMELGMVGEAIDEDRLMDQLDEQIPQRFFESLNLAEPDRQRQQA